jgi:hypothetical protein
MEVRMNRPSGMNIRLAVGEEYHLQTGKDRVIYAGMPSENVYSIVQRKASGYQGYSWNLYFPVKHRDVTIDGVRLYVERVTPEEMEIRLT